MQARLTDKAVERYSPKAARYEVHDTYLTGLSLRVTEKGRKSWYVMYRLAGAGPGGIKGKLIRFKIGDYPLYDLSKARSAAKDVLEPAEHGRDARLDRAAQRETEQTRTFEAVFRRFLEIHVKENTKHGRFARKQEESARKAAEGGLPRKRWRAKVGKCDAERYIEMFALPEWGNRLIESITRADAYDLLDTIRMEEGVPKARELRKHLATMFNWALNRGLLPYSPMAGLKAKELKYKARRRVLSMDELRRVWDAAGDPGYPFGNLVRLLILTGQRRSEVAELRSGWIVESQRAVLVPADRYKTGRDHLYPLSAPAWALVEKLPKWNAGECRFSTTSGLRPFSGFSKAKAALDKAIAEQGVKKGLPPMESWTLHDIRRSVASHLPRLGVPSEHVSAVLGHVIAKGSDAHYNHYDYLAEKRAALELWGRQWS
jgi:integrase